jgi:hypothetical protein
MFGDRHERSAQPLCTDLTADFDTALAHHLP